MAVKIYTVLICVMTPYSVARGYKHFEEHTACIFKQHVNPSFGETYNSTPSRNLEETTRNLRHF